MGVMYLLGLRRPPAGLRSTTPVPLDVERLARALMVVTRRQVFPGDRGYDSWVRQTAEAIAREYAAQ